MLALIGTVIVLACVAGGFLMAGGNLLALWHPSEVVIIIGAALGAYITSNPIKVVKGGFSGALALLKKPAYDRAAYVDLLKLIYDLLVKARKEGLLAIEADLEDPSKSNVFSKYPAILADHHMLEFITDCLRLMVGGNLDPQELESLLEYELETHHKEAHEPAHAVQGVADALPGFGIVAAVLGIVNTMGALEGADTATIGAKVGAALVGTFLGILMCYGFLGPMAKAMENKVHAGGTYLTVIRTTLVTFIANSVPQIAVEAGRRAVPGKMRPSFAELEEELKKSRKK